MISSKYSNFTQFGIKSEAERFIWSFWLIIIFISSLIGDTTILIASIKYNAFKLNNLVVVFIQHIAVSDLLVTLFTIFPRIVSLLSNSWVLGPGLCHMTAVLTVYGVPATSLLMSTLTLCKLALLKCPLRLRTLSRCQAHCVCLSV